MTGSEARVLCAKSLGDSISVDIPKIVAYENAELTPFVVLVPI